MARTGREGTSSGIVVRAAAPEDALFLIEHDHVGPDVITGHIEANQILVLEDSGVLVGWLRWSLFWDEIPFMNMLFVLESHRGRGFRKELRVNAQGPAPAHAAN